MAAQPVSVTPNTGCIGEGLEWRFGLADPPFLLMFLCRNLPVSALLRRCCCSTLGITGGLIASGVLGQKMPILSRSIHTKAPLQVLSRISTIGANRRTPSAAVVLDGLKNMILVLGPLSSYFSGQITIQVPSDAAVRQHETNGRQCWNIPARARLAVRVLAKPCAFLNNNFYCVLLYLVVRDCFYHFVSLSKQTPSTLVL